MSRPGSRRTRDRDADVSIDQAIARGLVGRLRQEQIEALRGLLATLTREQVDYLVDALTRAYGPEAVIIATRAYVALLDVLSSGISIARTPGDVLEPHPLPFGASGTSDPFSDGRPR